MKKHLITASIFIFWVVIVGVFVAGLIASNKSNQAITKTGDTAGQIGSITGVSANLTELSLTPSELTKHNSASSCWLLISGKIYDVTAYLNSHPGGEAEILKTCGTDATVIYGNRDNTGTHSSSANAMLADYFIGNLNQVLKMQTILIL